MILRNLILLLALCSCGPLASSKPALSLVQNAVLPTSTDAEIGAGLANLTRDSIEAQPNELMLVSVLERGATALVVRAGENSGKVTWLSPDGIGLTFENGFLISTRGLGFDLMSAEIGLPIAELRGGDSYQRRHEYLDGLDQIIVRTFECSVVSEGEKTITIVENDYQTEVLRENCEDSTSSFRNSYWRAADGTIWQARQWVSDEVGILGHQRLY